MELELLNEQVRGQLKDTSEPFVFAKAVIDPPKADELEQFVIAAVQDYSGFKPLKGKPGTLSLISGQRQYGLPPDFIEMEEFPYECPTPEADGTLEYFYTALHEPGTVPQTDIPCIVWSATAAALRALATDQKRLEQYVSYKVPDMVEVNADKVSEIGKALLKNASDMEAKYLKRVQMVARAATPYVTFG